MASTENKLNGSVVQAEEKEETKNSAPINSESVSSTTPAIERKYFKYFFLI